MKITVVGAGNVGATAANILAEKEVGNTVILLDVVKGLAEGKSLDIRQMGPLALFDTKTFGVTDDYEATANSTVVIITSGLARKPGMSRDDLLTANARIVKTVTENIIRYSPDAILIVVSNPLDAMAYVAYKVAGIPAERVMGMAGLLDTARYKAFLAEALECSVKDIQAVTLGGHGDDMVPLPRYTTLTGVPVNQILTDDKINEIVLRTRKGGGELVNLMGKSAWYAPGYATARMVEAIMRNQKRYFPCSAYLEGEYGLYDIFFGVPVKLGRGGIEDILEIELNAEEKALVEISANSVRQNIEFLNSLELW
ncbi:MAG: malate dehydrogenase [Bacteroidales bacterium]|nr:malate dehydrogenase [Bacteroidales bacterium]